MDVLTKFGFDPTTKIIQIVGDSGKGYSLNGTKFLQNYLRDKLLDTKIIIQWGLTGYFDGEIGDINGIVNNHIDCFGSKPIANIVNYHTPLAINNWGCTISESNRNFILVYDEPGLNLVMIPLPIVCAMNFFV